MAPLVRRSWSLRGHTPLLRQRTRAHQKVSAIAALCIAPARDRVALYFRLLPDTSSLLNFARPDQVNTARQLTARAKYRRISPLLR